MPQAWGFESPLRHDLTLTGEVDEQPDLSGTEIFQSVYLTIHQDILYSIGFTSEPADDEAEAAFDVINSSCAWTS